MVTNVKKLSWCNYMDGIKRLLLRMGFMSMLHNYTVVL